MGPKKTRSMTGNYFASKTKINVTVVVALKLRHVKFSGTEKKFHRHLLAPWTKLHYDRVRAPRTPVYTHPLVQYIY